MTAPDQPESAAEQPVNPYAPSAQGGPSVSALARLQRPSAPRVPGWKFWLVSAAAMVLLCLATYLTQGIALPLAAALPFAVVRTCIVQWRRAVKSLRQIPPLQLLLTSSLLMLGLGFGCTVAFCGICTSGVILWDTSPFSGGSFWMATWEVFSAIIAFVAFLTLFVWSIKWAS